MQKRRRLVEKWRVRSEGCSKATELFGKNKVINQTLLQFGRRWDCGGVGVLTEGLLLYEWYMMQQRFG